MRILFIADIVGKPGRRAVSEYLSARAGEFDFIIANGENAAGGKGLTAAIAHKLFNLGVNVITGGNHIWRNRDIYAIIEDERVVRPANYPPEAGCPGSGLTVIDSSIGEPVAVMNLLGRTFMNHFEDPFACAEELLADLDDRVHVILIDLHAETTSEKVAMFRLLDGRVSAVVGTHTHVQTADEQVSVDGTAYITDAGMTGPHDSVLGVETDIVLRQLRTQLPVRHELATGDVHLSGVVIDIDESTGRARSIERVFDPPR